jgi:hypothetical protein
LLQSLLAVILHMSDPFHPPQKWRTVMGSLPRRIAAVTLAAAAVLGLAGTADAMAATTRYFRAYGPNPVVAGQHAWAAAHAAGYTDAQCYSDNEVIAPGYWEVIVSCYS